MKADTVAAVIGLDDMGGASAAGLDGISHSAEIAFYFNGQFNHSYRLKLSLKRSLGGRNAPILGSVKMRRPGTRPPRCRASGAAARSE